jgi:MFS family permease
MLFRVYRDAFSGLPRVVWLLVLTGFINRCGTMVLPFLTLYLTARRGYSTAAAGAMLSLYGVGSVAGSLTGGWLCDRVDPDRVQVASLVGGGIGLIALGALERPWPIALAILATAFVTEAFRPANSTALALACPPADRSRAFGLRRLMINLGMTFGPAVGGILALHDYGWLFLVDGATCLLAAVPAWILVAPRRPPSAAGGVGPAPAGPSPWRDRPFIALVVLVTLLAISFFQLWSTYPLAMRHAYRLPENQIGFLFAINTLLIVAFEMVLINTVRAFSPLRVAAVGALLLSLGLGILPLGSTFAFAAFGAVVWTLGEMLSLPLIEAVVANRAGAGQSGRYMGLFTTSFSLAFVLSPLVGTGVYERFGSDALWYGCGAMGLVLWVGFTVLAPRLGRGTPAATPAPASL